MAKSRKKGRSKRAKLAAKFIKAFNDHDAKKALSLMSDEPIWEYPIGPFEWGIRHEGRNAVKRAIKTVLKKNPDISYKILRGYDAGDTVVFEVLVKSKSKGIREQSVDILTFDADDKIAIKRAYRKVVT